MADIEAIDYFNGLLKNYEGKGIPAFVVHSASIETCHKFGISMEAFEEKIKQSQPQDVIEKKSVTT